MRLGQEIQALPRLACLVRVSKIKRLDVTEVRCVSQLTAHLRHSGARSEWLLSTDTVEKLGK